MQTATLRVTETFESPLDEQAVWELISDPARVVPCMPGASLGAVRADGSVEGSIVASLGPVHVRFSGTVSPEYDHDNHRGTLVARGSDSGGRTRASATTEFRLEAVGERRTAVLVDATFHVSGGLAPFAQTGGAHLVRSMMADFSANLVALASDSETEAGTDQRPVEPTSPAPEIRGFRLSARVLWSMLRAAIRNLGRRRRGRQRDGPTQEAIGERHEGQ